MSHRLLLVGWDSADWKSMRPLMAAGHLPAVSALVHAGVSGDCTTLEPQLSPMLWTSIATGKMAYHHGVYGFTEVHEGTGQVAPVSAATRRCKTLWEMLGEHGLTAHVVGWFATQGERLPRGCLVSNLFPHLQGIQPDQQPAAWPAPPSGTFWPPELSGALEELRISPFEVEDILRLLVPDCASIDQEKDPRLMLLARRIAEAYSVHAATVWLMENRPDWDFFAVYFRAIDEICHTFMPYHQPGLPGVSERDIALYGQVVTGVYRLHDLMLARLLDLAGQGAATMLVSDHGFHSDHLRPQRTPNVPAGITVWHRRHGVFAAAGPGFRPRTDITGAGLLDLAPTILHYYGLPVGRDMEGRVLAEAFQELGEVRYIPSWESTGTPQPLHETAVDAAQLLDHFVALGYIDRPSDDPGEAAAATIRENKWNLARAHFHVGRYEDVLPLMEDCFFEFPERPDFSQLLAQAQVKLGLLAEAEETVGICLEMVQDGVLARLIQARIALLRGDHLRALSVLDAIRSRVPENPEILSLLARAYFFNRRWADAEHIARQVLERDAGHTFSKIVLARCALRRQSPREAVDWALAAVAENFADPLAFYLLGVAYSQVGDWANA